MELNHAQRVADGVRRRTGSANAREFALRLWSRVPTDDLAGRAVEDDIGASIAGYHVFETHDADEIVVRVDNLQGAAHTSVYVVTQNTPFVTDSVLMALSHDGVVAHHISNVVLAVVRGRAGRVQRIACAGPDGAGEVVIYAEIDRLPDDALRALQDRVRRALEDVAVAVGDFKETVARIDLLIGELGNAAIERGEVQEAIAFLEWLRAERFVFLGYREFTYADGWIRQVETPVLGVMRNRPRATDRRLDDQAAEVKAFLLQPRPLVFSKSGTRSMVHRFAYPDYVGVRRFNTAGDVIGEAGFLGLYTSKVYLEHPNRIPVVRGKVAAVIARANLDPLGFDGKVLAQVLAMYPRDELFEIDTDVLFDTATAVTYIHERRRTRVFVRYDPYGLFVNCLVYIPRDLYDTQARKRIQAILVKAFDAEDSQFVPYFSESVLVRLQVVLRIRPGSRGRVEPAVLQAKIVEAIRDWAADFKSAVLSRFGETAGRELHDDFADAFPAGYRERYSVDAAADDVAIIATLTEPGAVAIRLYRRRDESADVFHIKLFRLSSPLPLFDVFPVIGNLGVAVCGERAYSIGRSSGLIASVQDFEVMYRAPLALSEIEGRVGDALQQILGRTSRDDDGFNRLVLSAGLTWRQANVLRAYARYLKQVKFGFSLEFIFGSLDAHAPIAAKLFELFSQRFDPMRSLPETSDLRASIVADLDAVVSLNEDRVLRRFLELIEATTRTNFFVQPERDHLSLKLEPRRLNGLPEPVPQFEIFVLSPSTEGVHLRYGRIARGGVRWSDRVEDYRTEVLGLVKAQVTKNALIVPTGAKGGFVVRDARATGLSAYQTFVHGLLDVTDTIAGGRTETPAGVRRHDGDDPYLVVAADKGTASFSDAANEIARRRSFWLSDAFASGGSNGYDHKRMGITARGAWISVARHFSERNIDVAADPLTVVGIGDMSGDVFGNGMLLSRAIRLVAAFDHQHIFIDPDPNASRSFAERKRLFELDGSSWSDYDHSLISTGGGVFDRSCKSIAISEQMRQVFGIDANAVTPDALIHRLLKARVDLIFNGGIGTYVKSDTETDEQVGDRANDQVRVNASDLGCSVICEGGNLGLTQPARVAFALRGGSVNADFVDNSAGVDCSDHEVNIKILLSLAQSTQDLSRQERNSLLAKTSTAVANLVLANNAQQATCLALAEKHCRGHKAEYARFIDVMEARDALDRSLEHLPGGEEILERGLTRPELAVLMAYAKTHLKNEILSAKLHDARSFAAELSSPFPDLPKRRFGGLLPEHPLRPEIIATQVANDIVHHMGITFVVHLDESVGASIKDVVRCYHATVGIFALREQFRALANDPSLDLPARDERMLGLIRLGRVATRWLLQHHDDEDDLSALVERIRLQFNAIALPDDLTVSLPIIDAASRHGSPLGQSFENYREIGTELGFEALAQRIKDLTPSSMWQAIERDQLLDDLVAHWSDFAARIGAFDQWRSQHSQLAKACLAAVDVAIRTQAPDASVFSITCRRLGALLRSS